MARTPEAAALTSRQRAAQVALRADVLRDLTALWRVVDPTDLAGTVDAFVAAATVLIRARHRDSAGLAAAYLAAFRAAEGLTGPAVRALAEPPPAPVVAGQVRGAGLSAIITARRAGQSPSAAARNGLVKVAGAVSSLVLGGGRATIIDSLRRDEQALGWQRVTSGDPCAFCRMVASRGPVFKSERAASFAAHGGCACTPEPHYDGSRPPPGNERFADQWAAAQRQARDAGELGRGTSNDALNAYRRYLAEQAG